MSTFEKDIKYIYNIPVSNEEMKNVVKSTAGELPVIKIGGDKNIDK